MGKYASHFLLIVWIPTLRLPTGLVKVKGLSFSLKTGLSKSIMFIRKDFFKRKNTQIFDWNKANAGLLFSAYFNCHFYSIKGIHDSARIT